MATWSETERKRSDFQFLSSWAPAPHRPGIVVKDMYITACIMGYTHHANVTVIVKLDIGKAPR